MIQTWKELVTYSFDKRQLHTLGLSDDVSLLFSKHPPISSTSVNFVHKPLYIQIIGMLRAAKTWVFYQVLTHFPLHTPIKNPLVYDFYMNYFTWPRVHLLTSMLIFLCPPKKFKSTLGSHVFKKLYLIDLFCNITILPTSHEYKSTKVSLQCQPHFIAK